MIALWITASCRVADCNCSIY